MEVTKKTAPVVQLLGTNWMPEPFVDESTQDTTYYGWAPLGVGESENGWRIMRKKKEDGVTKCEYPNGSMDFVFNWTDRSNYDYGR